MPFINVKVSVPLTEEKRIAVKSALGQSIAVMGKSEDYLMVGFEENVPLYFAGEKEEKCAFVDVRVFGVAARFCCPRTALIHCPRTALNAVQ